MWHPTPLIRPGRWRRAGLGGGVPELPPGYQPPSRSDAERMLAKGLAGALQDITPVWSSRNMQVPVAGTVPLIKSVISTASGVDFGSIYNAVNSGQMTQAQIGQITGVVSQLVRGTLEVVVQNVAADVAETVAGVASAVPAIGQMAAMIISAIVTMVNAQEAKQQAIDELAEQLHSQLAQNCQVWTQVDSPYGTSAPPMAVTPADFFRRLAITYQHWLTELKPRGLPPAHIISRTPPAASGRWPLDAASMYLMLCGGETQGFGLDRARYQELLGRARAKNPKIGEGIPQDVQRQLWRSIRGILDIASGDPLASMPVGDQGMTLMPIIQDIVNVYFFKVREGDGPGWDRGLAELLSDEVTGDYRASASTGDGGAGVYQLSSSCAGQEHGYGRHVNLADALFDASIKFQAGLVQNFYDPSTRAWRSSPFDPGPKPSGGGQIVLSGTQSAALGQGILTSIGRRIEGSLMLKVLVSLVAGAGSYYAVRHYGVGTRW